MNFKNSRVLLKTAFDISSGYGRDGILLAQNFHKLGADLHLEPHNVGIPLPLDVAQYFAKERTDHFDVALHHNYPGGLGWPEHMDKHADKIVGWTMYEFTGFGDEVEMTHNLEKRIESLDMLLVYDAVSREAFLPYFDNSKIHILQGGYDSEYWKPKEDDELRDWDGTFKFCMNGTMNLRKNPWCVLFAFKKLKDEYGDAFDAELHMKTTSMALPPMLEEWCPGLFIYYENWNTEKLRSFYNQMHCLVAPSWGEGKNLPALEAQTTGCVAAVSAFGGHMQWADPDWAYLLEGTIEEHRPEMGSIRISVDTMAETMWHIYNNRSEAKLKGEKAAQIIPVQCDWERVLERLQYKLDDIIR